MISGFLGIKEKYLGVPSCAYQIGGDTVSKDGALSWGDLDDADPEHMEESCSLLHAIEEAGFTSEEGIFFAEQQTAIDAHETEAWEETKLSVGIPREKFSETAIANLKNLIEAKGALMKKAFGTENLELIINEEKISFPWFELAGPEETKAYTAFIQAISEMAITQTRISAKEKEIINEKYEFRCFLLRLGMIGDEYKAARKILMKNLSGSAAFKSGAKKGGEEK